jgi:hypothetical protein
MRYRVETETDWYVVRDAETDQPMGRAIPVSIGHPRQGAVIIENRDWNEIAYGWGLQSALIAVGRYEDANRPYWKKVHPEVFQKRTRYGELNVGKYSLGWLVFRNGQPLVEVNRGASFVFKSEDAAISRGRTCTGRISRSRSSA